MKALEGAINQVGAFSVIVQPVVEPMDRFTALFCTQTMCQLEIIFEFSRAEFIAKGNDRVYENVQEGVFPLIRLRC